MQVVLCGLNSFIVGKPQLIVIVYKLAIGGIIKVNFPLPTKLKYYLIKPMSTQIFRSNKHGLCQNLQTSENH